MCFRVARVERQYLPITGDRRVPAPLLRQHIGEIESRRGRVRGQRERALVARNRFGQPALLAAHIAEIEMGERVIFANHNRALEMEGHVIRAVERAPGQRDVVVILSLAIVGFDRLSNQLYGGRRIAAVERDEPQIVQAVRMGRNLREDMPVAAFRLGKRAHLMMRDRSAELIGNRTGGRRSRKW
jgi:hypothetical protein